MCAGFLLEMNILVQAYDTADPMRRRKAGDVVREGMTSGSSRVQAQILGDLFVALTRTRHRL